MTDKAPHWQAGLTVMNADKPGVATVHRERILQDLQAGKYVKDIAADLGVDHSAISHALSKDPEYALHRQAGMENRLEGYQEMIDGAPDGLTLSRGREGFRAQAWRCEREFPAKWGREAMVQVTANGPVSIQVISFADQGDAEAQRTIEQDPE